MKKLIVLIVAVIAFADETKFALSYEFGKEVLADKLTSTIDISFSRDTITEAKLVADRISIERLAGICTGGAISISPEYHYDKGKSTLTGHTSSISLACEFDLSKVDLFNEVVDSLQQSVSKNLGRFQMSAPKRAVSSDLKKEVFMELEEEATEFGLMRSKRFKDNSGYKRCNLSEVKFVQNFNQMPIMRTMSQKDSIDEPLQTKEKVSLIANMAIECK